MHSRFRERVHSRILHDDLIKLLQNKSITIISRLSNQETAHQTNNPKVIKQIQ